MKVNFFLLFIALVLSGLVFYGFYEWTDNNALYSWISAVASLFFLIPALAVGIADYPRGTVMMKTFSAVIFVVMLIANILFAKYEVSNATFIIANGVLLCIWAGICYGVSSAKQ